MNKEERKKRIELLVDEKEKSTDEIIEILIEESGKSKATIKNDFKELYPGSFEKKKEVDSIEEEEKSNVINIGLSGDPNIDKGRVSEYVVPEGEEEHIHVELEQTRFDSSTSKKMSIPYIQKFEQRAWLNFKKNNLNQGFTHCKVLFAPKGVDIETQKSSAKK